MVEYQKLSYCRRKDKKNIYNDILFGVNIRLIFFLQNIEKSKMIRTVLVLLVIVFIHQSNGLIERVIERVIESDRE